MLPGKASQVHAQPRGIHTFPSARLPALYHVVVGRWASTGVKSSAQHVSKRRTILQALSHSEKQAVQAQVCIIGSGPAAHTAAIYAARSDLEPLLFEGFMANGVAAGGQLTTTTYVENFPGFPEPILGSDLCDNFRKQSVRNRVKVVTETVERVDFSSRPYKVYADTMEVEAQTVIIATGAYARRLHFPGANAYWQKGISACAVCDGGIPAFRNQPLAVVGGGDVAMEEALYLTRYASKVYVVHRFDYLEASKAMQNRAMSNPKIEILWHHEVAEAFGDEDGYLGGIVVQDNHTGHTHELKLPGLFFAIGHKPATAFLDGQVKLDAGGYIITQPGSTATSVEGVFAAGDVQDRKYRQAITSAGTGCMAAIDAERYLAHIAPQASTPTPSSYTYPSASSASLPTGNPSLFTPTSTTANGHATSTSATTSRNNIGAAPSGNNQVVGNRNFTTAVRPGGMAGTATPGSTGPCSAGANGLNTFLVGAVSHNPGSACGNGNSSNSHGHASKKVGNRSGNGMLAGASLPSGNESANGQKSGEAQSGQVVCL